VPGVPASANRRNLPLAKELLDTGILLMLVGGYKQDHAWKARTYPVPTPSRSGFRWKASALRGLDRFAHGTASTHPATIMVPALYNFMPAETLAMGWLNEIDALATIRHRIMAASKITGWDVFTFHTLHNADHYFDTTIGAIRDTWMKEGNLSTAAHEETKRRFGKPYDYHRIHARLVENLVFQSSLLDWVDRHASGLPLRVHVIGTALLSALVSSGSISFDAAVDSAVKFGSRWDESLRSVVNAGSEDEVGWTRFEQILRTMEGRSSLSLNVARRDLPVPGAPVRPFWYSPTATDEPTLICTGKEAAAALETMNISSWAFSSKPGQSTDEPVRGWLVSPLHPLATLCKWSVSNYLLATPPSVTLFLDYIATIGRAPILKLPAEPVQNRLRLSRMKVTGP
jgi:hypothetical protein